MDLVRPGVYIAIRTPSDLHKLIEVRPHTDIALGKYGTFPSNAIIGRPYHLTYEILDSAKGADPILRAVPAAEQYAHIQEDASEEQTPIPEEVLKETNGTDPDDPVNYRSAFTLAKYELKRNKKARKQFTVLPMDAELLTTWMLNEKRAVNALELRPEVLAQMMGWANVHSGGNSAEIMEQTGDFNRWLAVDETCGLIVAAIAERIGVLYHNPQSDAIEASNMNGSISKTDPQGVAIADDAEHAETNLLASSNTITVVHANAQPNLSSLVYFGYDASSSTKTDHPLASHLQSITWLQLLHPSEDSLYQEPPVIPEVELAALKASKRGAYHRKRLRWERIKNTVDGTRAGGFSGLVVAANTEATGILRYLVPLVRSGGQVVVYAPTIEPLVRLQDFYSTLRKTAWITMDTARRQEMLGSDDFPVDPAALLGTAIYAVRARPWQVLPGRTHPIMQERGGADGFVFVGTRVIRPAEPVAARGKFRGGKKRKVDVAAMKVENGASTG